MSKRIGNFQAKRFVFFWHHLIRNETALFLDFVVSFITKISECAFFVSWMFIFFFRILGFLTNSF